MRPLDDVLADITQARSISDAAALLRLADELDEYDTPNAVATAARSRGMAQYMRGEYTLALSYLQRALSLFETHGDALGVARTTNNIGMLLFQLDDLTGALEHLNRAYELSSEIGDDHNIASIETQLGQVYRRMSDYPATLEHYHRSLSAYELVGDRNGAAGAISNIGGALFDIGDYPSALEHLHRALDMVVELGNRRFEAITLLNIGNVHDSMGDADTALQNFNAALKIFTEISDKSGIANILTCIGWTHQTNGDLSIALDYHHQSLALHKEIGAPEAAANDLCNVILVLQAQQSFDEARQHFAEFDTMPITDPALRIWREQCRAAFQQHDGDLDAARTTLQAALNVALEHNIRSKAADVHKELRDLAQHRNDLAAYIEHNNAYTGITEELSGKNTAAKLAAQEVERRIAAERQEHQKQLAVLHSTLPKHIADRVSRGEQVTDHYDNAAVIFLDIVGFTTISDKLSSTEVIQLLDAVFTALDDVCKKHDVVKIKTIGDSYMAVAFPEQPNNRITEQPNGSIVYRAANAALEMLDAVSKPITEYLLDLPEGLLGDLHEVLQVRIGLHVGAVTAGVLGKERLQYDVWGDTVNVASRMESTGEAGRIHVSSAFAAFLATARNDSAPHFSCGEGPVIPRTKSEEPKSEEHGTWHLALRGEIEIKGKGTMTTYWLSRLTE